MGSSFVYVLLWVLPSVLAGVMVGFYVGHGSRADKDQNQKEARKEREATLQALVALLQSTEQLATDVGSHNSEILQVGLHVGELKLTGELGDVQRSLLAEITHVLDSNQKLEEDLNYARCRMEQQAQEIDRTRLEARTDALSGVGNRKAFDERLPVLLGNWKRQRESFVLVLADVDHFKWINDTHGHPAGDRVVAHVGRFLKECVREGDYVARFGGDEFALLVTHAELELGGKIAERIRLSTSRTNFDVGVHERVTVTFSMGVAAVREGDTGESLLARADKALYLSKQSGRNQVQGHVLSEPDSTNTASAPSEPVGVA